MADVLSTTNALAFHTKLSKIDCYSFGSETILKSQLRQPVNAVTRNRH